MNAIGSVSTEKQSCWQHAAATNGNTMTEFVVISADAAAERTLKKAEFMELTKRDKVAFVQAISNNAAAPNGRLRTAAERYAQMIPAS